MKRLRRSYMTLMETLIAISLLSVLLVFVFGFFRELSEISMRTEQAQSESFKMRYLESRLQYIFERIVNENKTSRDFFFYSTPAGQGNSTKPSLVFTFDNGVKKSPAFSGDVLGKLYVDQDQRLCLAVWPLHVESPHPYFHEEVLFDNIADLRYSFYCSPEKVAKGTDIAAAPPIDPDKKMPEKDKWHDEWFETYEQLPSIIKIFVEVASEKDMKGSGVKKYQFHFVLPTSNHYVYFPPGELNL